MDKKLVEYSYPQNAGQWLREHIVTTLLVLDVSLVKGLILAAFIM